MSSPRTRNPRSANSSTRGSLTYPRPITPTCADRSAHVGVIGLGYVGLPLVELFADRGFRVLGLDIDASKVERLEAGQSYIGHISSRRVESLRDGGRFAATS